MFGQINERLYTKDRALEVVLVRNMLLVFKGLTPPATSGTVGISSWLGNWYRPYIGDTSGQIPGAE